MSFSMENVCNAIFEEPAIVDWEKRGDWKGLAHGQVEGGGGAYQEGCTIRRVAIDWYVHFPRPRPGCY